MFRRILLTLYAFLIIYYPPVLSIHGMRIVGIIGWIVLLLNSNAINKSINWAELQKILFAGFFAIIYIIFVGLINGNDFIPSIAGFVYCIISFLPATIVVGYKTKESNYDLFDYMTIILNAALIQSFISILSMLITSFKRTLLSWMINGHVFQEGTYTYALLLRLFGYSTGLTYGMPIVQTFLAITALYLSFEKETKYIVYIPFLLFSAFINSRTSVIVAVVCFFVLLIQRRSITVRSIFRGVIVLFGIIITIAMIPTIIEAFSPNTYKWVLTGYNEILRFAHGDSSSGYFTYLVNPVHWRIPEGKSILIGTGTRVMSGMNQYNVQSDIGYVNDLWLGGLFLTILTYFFWIREFRKIGKSTTEEETNRFSKFIATSFLATYFVINVKGYAFDLNNFTALFMLVVSFCCLIRPATASDLLIREKRRRRIRMIW